MAKYYKKPSGAKSVEENGISEITEGTIVWLEPEYVREDESPRKIVVLEWDSTYLLADNKRMYNNGEGYLYGKYSIKYYKNA